LNFLQLIIDKETRPDDTAGQGKLNLNFEDDLVKGTCIAHGGLVTNERVKALIV
jgi:NAD(P) transhydrogenase subunit alpha